MNEPDARRLLEAHLPFLAECAWAGWARWLGNPVPDLDKIARATVVNAWMVAHAARRAPQYGLVMVENDGLRMLAVNDLALVRFNKLDRNGMPSTNNTRQQRLFDTGQLSLDGLQDRAPLRAGYVLDEVGGDVERLVLMGCERLGTATSEWAFDLPLPGSAVVVPMPNPNVPSAPLRPVIRPAAEGTRFGGPKRITGSRP